MSDVRYRLDCIDRVAHKGIDYAPHTAACFVPIEIDYEAAKDEVKKYPTSPFGQSLGWGASIQDIVNAALGIEGGDDE